MYAANIGVIIVSLTLSAVVVNVSKRGDRGVRFPSLMEKVGKHLEIILLSSVNFHKPRIKGVDDLLYGPLWFISWLSI